MEFLWYFNRSKILAVLDDQRCSGPACRGALWTSILVLFDAERPGGSASDVQVRVFRVCASNAPRLACATRRRAALPAPPPPPPPPPRHRRAACLHRRPIAAVAAASVQPAFAITSSEGGGAASARSVAWAWAVVRCCCRRCCCRCWVEARTAAAATVMA